MTHSKSRVHLGKVMNSSKLSRITNLFQVKASLLFTTRVAGKIQMGAEEARNMTLLTWTYCCINTRKDSKILNTQGLLLTRIKSFMSMVAGTTSKNALNGLKTKDLSI